MRRTLLELFSCFSRALNVLRGGSSDWTLSAASHRDGLGVEAWIDWLFHRIDGPAHCRRWYLIEIERSRRNVELHDARQRGETARGTGTDNR